MKIEPFRVWMAIQKNGKPKKTCDGTIVMSSDKTTVKWLYATEDEKVSVIRVVVTPIVERKRT